MRSDMKQSTSSRQRNSSISLFGRVFNTLCLVIVVATGCVGVPTHPIATPIPGPAATLALPAMPTRKVAITPPAPLATPTILPQVDRLILRPILPEGRKLLEADRREITQILLRRSACLTAHFDVQWSSDERIIVTLLDVRDPNTVEKTLMSPGRLEFVRSDSIDLVIWPIEPGSYVRTSSRSNGPDPIIHGSPKDPFPDQVFRMILGGQHLKEAHPQLDTKFHVSIALEFTAEGKQLLATYTMQHVSEVLLIALDNILLLAPRITSPILDGSAIIESGPAKQWSVAEAGCMTAMMNSMLPFPLELVERSRSGSLARNP